MILNETNVVTTDTIYRGWMTLGNEGREADFVAAFHNSLTLLSAELEGRSFGGGVLELVPTEIGRLHVLYPPGFGRHLDGLDSIARSLNGSDENDRLVDETDRRLVTADVGLARDALSRLGDARRCLLNRRLERG